MKLLLFSAGKQASFHFLDRPSHQAKRVFAQSLGLALPPLASGSAPRSGGAFLNFVESISGVAKQKKMVCPHCKESGGVRTKPVKAKKGISGGKATAGVLTGGASLWATGLSRKEWVTEATCKNCRAKWQF